MPTKEIKNRKQAEKEIMRLRDVAIECQKRIRELETLLKDEDFN